MVAAKREIFAALEASKQEVPKRVDLTKKETQSELPPLRPLLTSDGVSLGHYERPLGNRLSCSTRLDTRFISLVVSVFRPESVPMKKPEPARNRYTARP